MNLLQAMYLSPHPAPADVIAEALTSKLGKGLLRQFDNRSEACRELVVSTFKRLLQAGPDATLQMLPYVMPVMEERLHLDMASRAGHPNLSVVCLFSCQAHMVTLEDSSNSSTVRCIQVSEARLCG
eukprot:GHRR01024092.1.p2 GENE.GHRR01024092.1~~GHRR01024092.1.p2  ORF type:complete len:126 (+),score=27.28 GHRR01024092.1:496-873(+)